MFSRIVLLMLSSFHIKETAAGREQFAYKAFHLCISRTAEAVSSSIDMFSWMAAMDGRCSEILMVCTRRVPEKSMLTGLCGRIVHFPLNRWAYPGIRLIQKEQEIRVAQSFHLNITFVSFDVSSVGKTCRLDRVVFQTGMVEKAQVLCGKKDPWFIITSNYFRITSVLTDSSRPLHLVYSITLPNVVPVNQKINIPLSSPPFLIGASYHYIFELRGSIISEVKVKIKMADSQLYQLLLYDGLVVSPQTLLSPVSLDQTEFKSSSHIVKAYVKSTREILHLSGREFKLEYDVIDANVQQCENVTLGTNLNIDLNIHGRCKVPVNVESRKYFVMKEVFYQYNGPDSLECDYAGYYIISESGVNYGPFCPEKIFLPYFTDQPTFVGDASTASLVLYSYHPNYELQFSAVVKQDSCRGVMDMDCSKLWSLQLESHHCYNLLYDMTKCENRATIFGQEYYNMNITWMFPSDYESWVLSSQWMISECKYEVNVLTEFALVNKRISFSEKQGHWSAGTRRMQILGVKTNSCLDRSVFSFIRGMPRACIELMWHSRAQLVLPNSTCASILLQPIDETITVQMYTSDPINYHYIVELKEDREVILPVCIESVTIFDKKATVDEEGATIRTPFKYTWYDTLRKFRWHTFSSLVTVYINFKPCYASHASIISYRAVQFASISGKTMDNGCMLNVSGFETVVYYSKTLQKGSWNDAQNFCRKNVPKGYSSGSLANIKTKVLLKHLQVAGQRNCANPLQSLYKLLPVYFGLSSKSASRHPHLWTDGSLPGWTAWNRPYDEEDVSKDVLPNLNDAEHETDSQKLAKYQLQQRQPQRKRDGRSCSAMLVMSPHQQARWFEVPCDSQIAQIGLLCEARKEVLMTTTPPPPKEERNVGIQCPLLWTKYSGSCFQLLTYLSRSPLWKSPEKLCSTHGGQVADVKNITSLLPLLKLWKFSYEYGPVSVKQNGLCSQIIGHLNSLKYEEWQVTTVECGKELQFSGKPNHVLCERHAEEQFPSCRLHEFACGSGECIIENRRCDGKQDCWDSSDELECDVVCQQTVGSLIQLQTTKCPHLTYSCPGNEAVRIPWGKVCDNETDCPFSVDEEFCPWSKFEHCRKYCDICMQNGKWCKRHEFCRRGFCKLCDDSQSECVSDLCTSVSSVCEDASDEGYAERCARFGPLFMPCPSNPLQCFSRSRVCNIGPYCSRDAQLGDCENHTCTGMFTCNDGLCIPRNRRCDGKADCSQAEDEVGPACNERHYCHGHLYCDSECVDRSQVCDGIIDCPNGDDEKYCTLAECPELCTCIGFMMMCVNDEIIGGIPFYTKQMQVLVIHNFKLKKLNFLSSYNNLIFLDLSANRIPFLEKAVLHNLGFLQALILRDNMVSELSTFAFDGPVYLQHLDVRGNPLRDIAECTFCGLSHLQNLNLSGLGIRHLSDMAFVGLYSLSILDLSSNEIDFLSENAFSGIPVLNVLDISNNPLSVFSLQTFDPISTIMEIRSDQYKVCCAAKSVMKCLPEAPLFSSCDDLMSDDLLRICLWTLAVVCTFSNVSVVIHRRKTQRMTAFSQLVLNLGYSDFLMGIYLAIIAVADQWYRGIYFIHEENWRRSAFCRSAGVISMVSSEMSLCNLVLITTDRTLVLALNRRGFTKHQARLSVNTAWCLVIILSVLPVAEFEYFGQVDYIKHGVCFLFNFTEGKVPGWEYAAVIFIVFNGVCLIWIVSGYTAILVMLLRNSIGDDSIEGRLARKMALVILTDCLCWMPPMILGARSLLGYETNPKIAMWMSVLVFPLNSSLNPFLYTLGNRPEKSRDIPVDATQDMTRWETTEHAESLDEGSIVEEPKDETESENDVKPEGEQQERTNDSFEVSRSSTKKTSCQVSRRQSFKVKGFNSVETEVQISMTIEMTDTKRTTNPTPESAKNSHADCETPGCSDESASSSVNVTSL